MDKQKFKGFEGEGVYAIFNKASWTCVRVKSTEDEKIEIPQGVTCCLEVGNKVV
ncbi:MAG: hypothetical protein Q9218_003629 [Villophora microphyllina]